MTAPMPDLEDVMRGLTSLSRERLASVHPRFGVKDIWRPDEGESHAPYAAMVRKGILGRQRSGDFPTVYWLTPFGLELRTRLLSSGGEG